MEPEDATNQAAVEDVHVEDQAGVETDDLDTEGQPVAEPEDEEVEYEGQKHRIPKALKGAFMMQADYTRKTQEVAELRKAAEAERAQAQEANAETIREHAKLVAYDDQIGEWERTDWDAWEAQDPAAAARGWRQYQQLKDARSQVASSLSEKERQRAFEQQRSHAQQLEQAQAVLARDIPGWGPDLQSKLLTFGAELGFSREELGGITDPRVVKVLHAAMDGAQAKKSQARVQTIQTQAQTKPAPTVGAKSSPPIGLDDRLGAEEWVRRRNAQLRKR